VTENGECQHMGSWPRSQGKVHTGRHYVDAGVGIACCMRAIMPLPVARFDFLSLWADEALLPADPRVAACFGEGWI